MNRLRNCLCGVGLVAVLGAARDAPAQVALQLPTSARSYGMGETGVADAEDPANVYYNPAMLFMLRKVYFTTDRVEFSPFGTDENLHSLGVSGGYELLRGSSTSLRVGADLRYTKLDFGNMFVEDGFERYYGVSAGVGLSVQERYFVGLGGTLKPYRLEENDFFVGSGPVTGDATVFDVGFFAAARFQQANGTMVLSLGASARNLGADLEVTGSTFTMTSALPDEIRAGLGIRFIGRPHAGLTRALGTPVPAFVLGVNLELQKPQSSSTEVVRGGFEVGIVSLVFLRVGFFDAFDTGFSASPSEITYGFGLNLPYKRWQLGFDYARFDPGGFRAMNRFGAAVAFLY